MSKQIIAQARVTREAIQRLGSQFDYAYPIETTPCFGELLHAIDLADRQISLEREKSNAVPHESSILAVID